MTCRADKKAVRQTISANNEPDLFWGMRGAGGSLGVAIQYTTHAFEIPDNVRIPVCGADDLYGGTWAANVVVVQMNHQVKETWPCMCILLRPLFA